jgi:hypothetical protein
MRRAKTLLLLLAPWCAPRICSTFQIMQPGDLARSHNKLVVFIYLFVEACFLVQCWCCVECRNFDLVRRSVEKVLPASVPASDMLLWVSSSFIAYAFPCKSTCHLDFMKNKKLKRLGALGLPGSAGHQVWEIVNHYSFHRKHLFF